jgi:hypothetical protein
MLKKVMCMHVQYRYCFKQLEFINMFPLSMYLTLSFFFRLNFIYGYVMTQKLEKHILYNTQLFK